VEDHRAARFRGGVDGFVYVDGTGVYLKLSTNVFDESK